MARRADDPDAAGLLAAYLAELGERLGSFDPALSVSASPDEMAPPHGAFLVLYDDGVPVACGGLKTQSPGVGEIKRMYVAAFARGHGHGTRLLAALEDAARALGHRRIVLDTAAPLHEAAALYRAAGYGEVPPFNDNRYASRWFEKTL